jgi:POT family proton-dependent oligopeptide transporter
VTCAANLLLFAGCTVSDRVSVIYPIMYDVILGVAFLYYWSTLLALVSRAALAGLKATLLGVVFLSLFVSNILVGWIGGLYEHVTPAMSWARHG